MNAIPTREQILEDEVEILKQQLQAVIGTSKELGVIMSIGHGMTSRLAIILFILVSRAPAVISRQAFHTIFYGDRDDGGPEPKIFNVHISRLRNLLKRVGCNGKICTIWNAGFQASPELVEWVKHLYDQHIPQE